MTSKQGPLLHAISNARYTYHRPYGATLHCIALH